MNELHIIFLLVFMVLFTFLKDYRSYRNYLKSEAESKELLKKYYEENGDK